MTVILGSFFLAISGGGLLIRAFIASDYFRISGIQVENGSRVASEDIVALSHIRTGTNIFSLNLERIGRKIEENPWIASARVQRIFPDLVVIRISEREPRAVVNLGYLYYLDDEGEIFKLIDSSDTLDYPVVTGIDRKNFLEEPEEAHRILKEAVALLDKLGRRTGFGLEDVSEIHYDPVEGYILFTCAGGVPIHLGFSNFEGKLSRLDRIYKDLESRLATLQYIDLNVADRVIVKLDAKSIRGKG